MQKEVEIKCPVKLNSKVWVINGQGIEQVTVTAFMADEDGQKVQLSRDGKQRSIWKDINDFGITWDSDCMVLIEKIKS